MLYNCRRRQAHTNAIDHLIGSEQQAMSVWLDVGQSAAIFSGKDRPANAKSRELQTASSADIFGNSSRALRKKPGAGRAACSAVPFGFRGTSISTCMATL